LATQHQNLKFILLAGALTGLAACSSNPSSPWGQGGSPWESRSQDVAEQPVVEEEPVAAEPVDAAPAPSEETAAEPVVGEPGTPMEDPVAATAEAEPDQVADEPVAEPVEAAPAEEAVAEPAAPAQSGDIASLPAEQFAVQVVASSSMENLLAFASAHNIADDWTAKTMLGDKVWYILLSGVYASKAEAQAALAEVSGQLDTAPWIRNVGSIQKVMAP